MTTPVLNWHLSRVNSRLIDQITKRAATICARHEYTPKDLRMDLTACHNHGCEMDFQKLLDAPLFDFAHDILGIRRHINRTTGALEDFFSPRCHA